MKKGLKTLAMWLIMGIILIVLISAIMDNSQTKMTYSELIVEIESGKVENVEISADGKKAYVTLKANPKIEKEVNIPSVDSFMDKINNSLACIISITDENFIFMYGEKYSYKQILRLMTFVDSSPLGILINN